MDEPIPAKVLRSDLNFAVAMVAGYEQPVVILDVRFLNDLEYALSAAKARALTISPGQDTEAILQLCQLLSPILARHREAHFQYMAERPLPKELAEIEREMERLRRILDQY